MDNNPKTGIDCIISIKERIHLLALRHLAAKGATVKVNIKENTMAINMRSTVLIVYSGKNLGSKDMDISCPN